MRWGGILHCLIDQNNVFFQIAQLLRCFSSCLPSSWLTSYVNARVTRFNRELSIGLVLEVDDALASVAAGVVSGLEWNVGWYCRTDFGMGGDRTACGMKL